MPAMALANITCMAQPDDWRHRHNDLWHWFKHTQPLIDKGALLLPDLPDLATPEDYLALARRIGKGAANYEPGSEFKIRTRSEYEKLILEYLVWWGPPGAHDGIFLVVKD